MYYIIERDFYFSASHRLPGHKKCGVNHGHNWKVTISIYAEKIDDRGMTIDFGDIKAVVQRVTDHRYDHQCLSDRFPYPTAEVISRDLYEVLKKSFDIFKITIEETRDCRVIFHPPRTYQDGGKDAQSTDKSSASSNALQRDTRDLRPSRLELRPNARASGEALGWIHEHGSPDYDDFPAGKEGRNDCPKKP